MQARMKSPGIVIPDAMTAIRSLNKAVQQGGVPSARSTWSTCEPARSTGAASALAPRPRPEKMARQMSGSSLRYRP